MQFSLAQLNIHFLQSYPYQLNAPSNGSSHRVYALIRSWIATGALASGERLPSTRALATDLGVSRSTVVVVYEQLAAEGYIETAVGSRARVAAGLVPDPHRKRPRAISKPAVRLPALSAYGDRIQTLALPQPPLTPPRQISFLYGAIADEDFPKLAWRKLYNRALTNKQRNLYYRPAEGEADLRMAIQGYLLRARGLQCTSDQILIVQGSQQALELCARVLVDPGKLVVTEEPCYLMARRTFESVGAEVIAAPVDEQGLMTDALPEKRSALAYVTPSHQFPLGSVMSISRRQALLAWAERQLSWIIEDDYDSEFRYGLRPVNPLQSLDSRGCVIYVGTFSKALSPQLRLGYLVLPPTLIQPFRRAKQLADRHAPTLDQLVLAELIRSGAYERHLRRLRRENERRRDALIEALSKHFGTRACVEGTDSGLHVVVWMKEISMHEEQQVVAKAKELGVGLYAVSPLYAEGTKFRKGLCAGFVMGYASLQKADIDKGVKLIAKAIMSCGPS